MSKVKDSSQQNDEMSSTFPKKYARVLKDMPEFRELAESASTEDLKKIIVVSEGNVSTIEKAKSENVKINAAREIIKDESGPYKDALKCQLTKIKYAVFLLEGRGVEVGDKEGE